MQKPWNYEEPLCAEVGTDIFFVSDPDEQAGKSAPARSYTEAKKICDMCVHKVECAEWGIENEVHGMWGGLTPRDRNIIRRRMGIVRNPRERFIL